MLDVVLRGGTVVDGTGAPGSPADVGIRDGRVVAVGDVDESASRTIDVTDLLLNGKMIRGCIEGDANPSEFIPELLALHAQGRFPMEAIVQRYDAVDIETAVADSRSGVAIKPVLVW